jgi:SAM-dependent methyltransferase
MYKSGWYQRLYKPLVEDWKRSAGEADLISGLLGLPRGARIVDLGCGPGRLTIALARLGYRVTAVDYVPAHLAALESTARDVGGLDVELIEADICKLPDFEKRFDAVVCWHTYANLEHGDAMECLEGCHDALKPGGHLLLDMPAIGVLPGLQSREWVEADGVYTLHDRWFQPVSSLLTDKITVIDRLKEPVHLESRNYLYSPAELRAQLETVTFDCLSFMDGEGGELEAASSRMIVSALA